MMVITMQMSPRGVVALAGHEALVPGPYLDSANVWTWGIGHTASAGAPDPKAMTRGMPADLDAAIREGVALFVRDLAKFEARVNQHVKAPIEQHEFDALVSFDFNTGGIYYRSKAGKMVSADLVAKLNAGDLGGAAASFMNWSKPASIIERRRAEQRLFQIGAYPDQPMNVWQVTEAGRVIWKPIRAIQPAELLALVEETRPAPIISPPLPRPDTDDAEAIAWAEWINGAPAGALAWLRAMPLREGTL